MANPMGEAGSEALRLDFDRRLMLQFRGSVIASDGGLLVYRELDDVLALTTTGGERLADARTGKNDRHQLVGLLRQSVFGRLAGYEDVNDAERLCRDSAMRWVVGGRAPMGQAASASQMGRFETEWLPAEAGGPAAACDGRAGVKDTRTHIFLRGQGQIGTLVVSAAPLTPAEIATLQTTAERYRHKILLSPDQPPASEVLRGLWESRSIQRRGRAWKLARYRGPGSDYRSLGCASDGDERFAASALGSDCRAAADDLGNGFFLLVGDGSMFVEIGLIQRISVFLGHPVYALSIGLFSIIFATGLGSFASERIALDTTLRLILWAVILAGYMPCCPRGSRSSLLALNPPRSPHVR